MVLGVLILIAWVAFWFLLAPRLMFRVRWLFWMWRWVMDKIGE